MGKTYEVVIREYDEERELQGIRFILEPKMLPQLPRFSILRDLEKDVKKTLTMKKFGMVLKSATNWSKEEEARGLEI